MCYFLLFREVKCNLNIMYTAVCMYNTEMVNKDLLKTDPSIKSFILLSETSQAIYMHVYYKDSAMYITVTEL